MTFNGAIRRRLSSAFSPPPVLVRIDGSGSSEETASVQREQSRNRTDRRNSLETGLKMKTSVRTKVGELSNNLQTVMTGELNGILKIIEELLRTQLSDNKITDIISILI